MFLREQLLQQVQQQPQFDIIIIGGGATGLGCAVDAANRGYTTLLLEAVDFGKGTSSKSTKLVHGGVRYLAQGNIKLVKEALEERGRLLKNAPHCTSIQAFVIPVYSWWQWLYYGIGLTVYHYLSGKLKIGTVQWLGKQATLKALPNIIATKLFGGIVYYDGQFNDTALCTSLMYTALQQKAMVLNYCKVIQLVKQENKVQGVVFTDTINNANYTVYGKAIINATGVFVNDIMRLDAPNELQLVAPSQGIHLVIDAHFFKGSNALMIPKTKDGRVLFAVPWQQKIIIGTTDTPIATIDAEPLPLQEEVQFIIDHFNAYCNTNISKQHVLSVFVGLRPLVKKQGIGNTALLARDHTIVVKDSNLITVTGGKWTTYRKMAEQVIDNAIFVGKLQKQACNTKQLSILQPPIDKNIQQQFNQKIHPNYGYTFADIYFAIHQQMAQTVEDVLARRTRLLFLDAQAAIDCCPTVANFMQQQLHTTNDWKNKQIHAFTQLAKQYTLT
jgi:glycerol-3-phosphate dehydrogenase